jgi:hypothetical protein
VAPTYSVAAQAQVACAVTIRLTSTLAQAQATAAGLTREGFLARRYARIWQIFQQQFGGSARIVRVAGLFSGTSGYNSALLTELRDFGSTLTPPVAVDAVAPTVYFGNGIQDWVYEQANLNRASAPAAWFLTAQDFTANSVTRPVSSRTQPVHSIT